MSDWEQAETELVNLLYDVYGISSKLVTDLHNQYRDIDVMAFSSLFEKRYCSFSVKDVGNVEQYGTILFEKECTNTDTLETKLGSLGYCEAEKMAVRFKHSGSWWYMVYNVEELRSKLENGTLPHTIQYTKKSTAIANRAAGWTFNSTSNYMVKLSDLKTLEESTIYKLNSNKWKVIS